MPEPGMGANNDHSPSGADRGSGGSNDNNRGGASEKESFDRSMSNAERPGQAPASPSDSSGTDKPDRAAGPPGIGAPPSGTSPANDNNKPDDKNDDDNAPNEGPGNRGGFFSGLAETLSAPPTDASGNPRSTSPVADRVRNSTVNYSFDDVFGPAKSPRDAAIDMANAEFGVGMQVMRQDLNRAIDRTVAEYDQKIADVDQRLAEIDGRLSPSSVGGLPGPGMAGIASPEEARALMAESQALTSERAALEAKRTEFENARNLPDTLDMGHIAKDVYEVDTQLANSHISRLSHQELAELGFEPGLLENAETGFHAEVYRNSITGEAVLAFQGTDFKSIEDWKNNVGQGLGLSSPQYEQALRTAEEFDRAFAGEKRSLTGHSLGGGLAAYASVATGIEATTFNAAGLHARTLDRIGATREEALGLVTAHHVKGEALNWAQDSVVADLVTAGILGPEHALNSDLDPMPESLGVRHGYEAIGVNGLPPDYRGGLRSDLEERVSLHFMESMLNTLRQENQRLNDETRSR